MNKRNKLSSSILAVLALGFTAIASPAFAATTSSLQVNSIELTSGGSAYVHFNKNLNSAPCTNKDMIYFDATTAAGKNFYTEMLSAYMAAKGVSVSYNAACVSNTATMTWMHIYN